MSQPSGSTPPPLQTILYDLLVTCEWPPEQEIPSRPASANTLFSIAEALKSRATKRLWTILRSTGLLQRVASPCLLPTGLLKFINLQQSWKIVLSSDGEYLAIVQDLCVEIRRQHDGFVSLVGRYLLDQDANPQWRNATWNDDSTILAVSTSTGELHAIDILGNRLFKLHAADPSVHNSSRDLSEAIASILFVPTRRSSSSGNGVNLMVTNFHGCLSCYRLDSNSEAVLDHQFSFGDLYPSGISTVIYSRQHDLLIVGGSSSPTLPTWSEAGQEGITAWRVLSAAPYYKLATTLDEDRQKILESRGKRVLKRMKTVMSGIIPSNSVTDGIHQLCLSPEGRSLLALHYSGAISFWDVPSLRLSRKWDRQLQPAYGLENPTCTRKSKWPKPLQDKADIFAVVGAKWWCEEAVILSCASGAVTVTDVNSAKNILGESPEWFEPCSQVSGVVPRGSAFLVLECELHKLKARAIKTSDLHHDESAASDLSDNDQDDGASLTVVQRATIVAKQLLKFYLTDDDSRWPKKTRHRLRSKTYKLVLLKKTTPEELYARKINDEEYGEALALARLYGLDADLVYQKQFQRRPVTLATIQDYLSKIKKRSWVLHECLDRVPHDVDAARELLNVGLRCTSLAALVQLGAETGNTNDELTRLLEDLESSRNLQDSADPEQTEQQCSQTESELLKLIQFDRLTLEQKELCRARLRLLQYSDRLTIYEEILGGPHAAERHFDSAFFEKFRSQDIVEAVVAYAQAGDWKAVEIIFTYLGRDTLPHRLAVLANFPETQSPSEYASLLPVVTKMTGNRREQPQQSSIPEGGGAEEQQPEVLPWPELSVRQLLGNSSFATTPVADWCELDACLAVVSPDPGPNHKGHSLYEDEPNLMRFLPDPGQSITVGAVTEWYLWRATNIDALSCQVENAALLVKLGIDGGVPGLVDLCNDLTTMEVLVYECGIGFGLRLDSLRSMSDTEKVHLLMSKSTLDMFVKNLHRWLVPFLHRCEARQTGSYDQLLASYVISLAEENMQLALKVFDASKASSGSTASAVNGVIRNEEQLLSLALACVYASDRSENNSFIAKIVDCLPAKAPSRKVSPKLEELYSDLEKLKTYLRVSEILTLNEVQTPLVHIRNSQLVANDARMLMVKLTRRAGCREPALKDSQWRKLLEDMLTIRNLIYTDVLDEESCFEIFLESLLCSGKLENIQLAGSYAGRTTAPVPQAKTLGLGIALSGQKFVSSTTSPAAAAAAPLPKPLSGERMAVLVLRAAREYFNSASSSADLCMALAKATLLAAGAGSSSSGGVDASEPLFAAVREELDLVAAVSLAEELGLQQLPLQVRLCQDRITIIENVIAARKDNYKQHQKLLHLGTLLHIIDQGADDASRSSGSCRILHCIARHALAMADYAVARTHCKELMDAGYGDAWTECSELAAADRAPTDDSNYSLDDRLVLLSFVAAHCSADVLERTLRDLCLVQLQAVQWQLSADFQLDPAKTGAGAGHAADGTQLSQHDRPQPLLTSGTKDLMALTGRTTRTLFKAIMAGKSSSERLLEGALSAIARPLTSRSTAEPADATRASSPLQDTLDRQRCNDFYDDIMSGCQATASIAPDAPCCLLRASVLQQTIVIFGDEGNSSSGDDGYAARMSEVLIQCASNAARRDLTLALSYLLALPQISAAENYFGRLAHTPLALHVMAYYTALQVASTTLAKSDGRLQLYTQPPDSVVPLMCEKANSAQSQDANIVKLFASLRHYVKLMEDHRQAQMLHDLGRGVDSVRFTNDDSYKRDTILGLAMSADESHYDIATSLARKYDVSKWDVDMVHLEFLFCDSGLGTADIEARMNRLHLLDSLRGCSSDGKAASQACIDRFCARLESSVFPSIDGTDHGRLLLYYQLLPTSRPCCDSTGLTAGEHVKIIKKVSAAAPALDYIRLVQGHESCLTILEAVLSAGNVHVFAKLASKLPNLPGGAKCTAGAIYRTWIEKSFWEGHGGSKRAPETASDWVHRFEQASGGSGRDSPLQRLAASDVVALADALLLSARALDRLPHDASSEIASRLVRTCQRQSAAHAKEPRPTAGSQADEPEADAAAVTWADAVAHVQALLEHISNMHSSETLVALCTASAVGESSSAMRSYYEALYRSASSATKIRSVLKQMLIDGQPLELVNDLIVALPCLSTRTAACVGTDCSVRALVGEALEGLCSAVRAESATAAPPATALVSGCHLGQTPPTTDRRGIFDGLLSSVVSHVIDGGGDLVQADDVLDVMRPFLTDESVPQPARLHVLGLLERCFSLSEPDQSLLALCRAQAIVTEDLWPAEHAKITAADVEDCASREKLFAMLLESGGSSRHLEALGSLLMSWPPPTASKSALFLRLFEAWLQPGDLAGAKEVVRTCRKLLAGRAENQTSRNDEDYANLEECLQSPTCKLLESRSLRVDALRLALLSCIGSSSRKMIGVASELLQHLSAADVAQASSDEDILSLLAETCRRRRWQQAAAAPSLAGSLPADLLAALCDHAVAHWQQAAATTDECSAGPVEPLPALGEGVTRELRAAGLEAEAACLAARGRGVPSGLRSFGAALAALDRWFPSE